MAKVLVNIDVDDLDRGVRFYREGLGLRVGRRFGKGTIELLGAAAPIFLLRKEAGHACPLRGPPAGATTSRHWTPVHLDFAVDDLEAAVSAGAGRPAPPAEGDISDPRLGQDGAAGQSLRATGCCLLQFRERGYDAITSG